MKIPEGYMCEQQSVNNGDNGICSVLYNVYTLNNKIKIIINSGIESDSSFLRGTEICILKVSKIIPIEIKD